MNPLAFSLSDPIGSVVGTVEFRTTFSPPINFSRAEVGDLASGRQITTQQSALLRILKPTLISQSPVLGTTTIAPYGIAAADDWQGNQAWLTLGIIGALATAMGLGYWLGKR